MAVFLVASIVAVIALIARKSRSLSAVLIIFMLIIGLGNTKNADFMMFFTQYNNPVLWKIYGATELGYRSLVSLFYNIGLSFMFFRNTLLLISIILVILTVKDITDSVSAVLALFFFVPFIINITQYRFFFASAICLFAARFLLKDKKFGVPIYIALVLIAGLFHTSTLYYLFFIAVRIFDEKKLKYCAVGGTVFALALIPTGLMRKLLQSMTTEEKATAYFGKSQSLGIVLAWLLVLSMVFFIEYSLSSKGYTSSFNEDAFNSSTLDQTTKKIAYLELIRRMNYLCLPILILLIFDVPSCYRLFRGLLYMEYAAFFVSQYELKPQTLSSDDRERLLMSFGLVLLCGINFWALTTMHTVENWFYPILDSNMFWTTSSLL